jgi:hypothetical protein
VTDFENPHGVRYLRKTPSQGGRGGVRSLLARYTGSLLFDFSGVM